MSGCSVTPLNNITFTEGGDLGHLDIYVGPIPEKQGVLLRQHLEMHFTQGKRDKNSRYHLLVIFQDSERGIGISSKNTDSRKEIEGRASFRLLDHKAGVTVCQGSALLHGAYSVSGHTTFSAYATHIAQRDTKEKILAPLAEDIAHQIRVHFSHERSLTNVSDGVK
ncbi:MAG: hypothetical protein H6849_02350 [Alphaproteobacteria bacterium]|nr:MAG: hypothetical protein H6849_02350 [Alphaproteobacteria bacterium]